MTGSSHWRWWLILGGMAMGLLLMETGARIWISLTWSPEERGVYLGTDDRPVRGRFAYHPVLGYVPRPHFTTAAGATHNSAGLRGPEISLHKAPGTLRVVLAGASTIYGEGVSDEGTSAAQLERLLRQSMPDVRAEVLNAGVPNWTSAQTVASLPIRILPLEPDIVVVMDGRNDVFPQLFNNYREDYSHYQVPGYDFRNNKRNASYKRLFRVSRLAMMLCVRGGGRCGFSERAENPAYSSTRYENAPTPDELRRNAAEPARGAAFRQHLEHIVRTGRAQGVDVVLVTVPFRMEGYGSNVIARDAATLPFIAVMVRNNQQITREVARRLDVVLVDAATLSHAELLLDDAHFNPAGAQAFAKLLLEGITPLLRKRRSEAMRSLAQRR